MLSCCNELSILYVNSALENTAVDEDPTLYGFPLTERYERFEERKAQFTNDEGRDGLWKRNRDNLILDGNRSISIVGSDRFRHRGYDLSQRESRSPVIMPRQRATSLEG
jgi:hypothetical protein